MRPTCVSTSGGPDPPDTHERTSIAGVATGLAVTGLGGDVLFVEASALDGVSRVQDRAASR